MHIHAMWQMGLEYCDAIVYQAKVHQAKKVYEEDAMTVEDSVKSAMSPFLVLEVRRDHLIEDTLVHVKLKVGKNIFRYHGMLSAEFDISSEKPSSNFPTKSLNQDRRIPLSYVC